MQLQTLFAALLLSTSTHAFSTRSSTPKDAILLSKVRTLTLRSNALTSHRRVPAVPQLSCKGPGCAYYKIDTLRCTNSGTAYGDEDIEWSCTASIPEEFKLGSTDVACEGYSSRDDPYVLKGSCGVEYRLLLTDKGEEKYGKPRWGGSGGSEEWNWGSVLFMFLFVGVLGWIVYSACVAARPAIADGARDPRRPGFFGGGGWNPGGGGGGGDGGGPDDNDPPPPYPGTKPYGSQPQQAWRPGWTGAAAAAGLGYLAANRGRAAREREPLFGQQPQRQNNGGWFGGGNNQGYQAPNRSDSNGSSSSARHESTGFGSTSRR